MKFPCTNSRRSNGQWFIRHLGDDAGTVEVTTATRNEAIEKMRGELRDRLELCPRAAEAYKALQIERVEGKGVS